MGVWPTFPRSKRSRPSGPGSRGGSWHLPAFRKAYRAAWRLAHPAYRARERMRSLLNAAEARAARVVAGGRYARPVTVLERARRRKGPRSAGHAAGAEPVEGRAGQP